MLGGPATRDSFLNDSVIALFLHFPSAVLFTARVITVLADLNVELIKLNTKSNCSILMTDHKRIVRTK